jgi:hypothetical protein
MIDLYLLITPSVRDRLMWTQGTGARRDPTVVGGPSEDRTKPPQGIVPIKGLGTGNLGDGAIANVLVE